ncbi:uncharacterized protein LOC129609824 [Condylostylus longicornis]|uniref:uncharacterized protein LOC129609824 n=1 Tax=Condylostylus longicornis TaxID=2530218 RepID=UPI00244DB67B|nr:uncharacterized protein LOC129609824 [Condylostylus longicornis]
MGKYSEKTLQCALQEIKNGMSVRSASKKFNIPRTTLQDKKFKRHQQQVGAPSFLTAAEEQTLVKWILDLASRGFPVTKSQLLQSVSKLAENINRPNKFKNGMPGKFWYKGFLNRNPNISERVSQTLTTGRANVTAESLKKWFQSVSNYFENFSELKQVLSNPERIFNCDETAFFLCPKGNKVLAQKGSTHTYIRSANDEKECLTVLIGASAVGKLMPTLVLFQYKRIPANIVRKMPTSWGIGSSDSGWMTCQTFYEYITNCFYPYLLEKKIELPIILFLDGHSSHISLHLTNFCREKGIILKQKSNLITTQNKEYNVNQIIPEEWTGCKKDESLFYIWQSTQNKIQSNNCVVSDNTTQYNQTLIKNIFDDSVWEECNNIMELVIHPDEEPASPTALMESSVLESKNNVHENSSEKNIKIDQITTLIENDVTQVPEPQFINDDTNGTTYSTPFKKALFWPEIEKSGHKKAVKRKLTPKTKINEGNIKTASLEINVSDYVIVLYEEEKYPGIILSIENDQNFKVKTMTMSGTNWRWPEKDDILVYQKKDIIKKLNHPLLLNSRGVYSFNDFH